MIFVLDNIRSKFNIGSIFRTCDAFNVKELVLCWICAYPPDEEISKTAIWAENSVQWVYYQNTIDAINHYKSIWKTIVSIEWDERSIDIWNAGFTWDEAFIFGNEIDWVSKDILALSDKIISIPMLGTSKESLNVWVTAGIIWAFVRNAK